MRGRCRILTCALAVLSRVRVDQCPNGTLHEERSEPLSPRPDSVRNLGQQLFPGVADQPARRGQHRPVRRRVDGPDHEPAQGSEERDRLSRHSARPFPGTGSSGDAPMVASCMGQRVPGFHVEQACATGLQAVLLAGAQVEAAPIDVVGVLTFDRTSDSPVGVFPERRAHRAHDGARRRVGQLWLRSRDRQRHDHRRRHHRAQVPARPPRGRRGRVRPAPAVLRRQGIRVPRPRPGSARRS